jgi:hypothetical protein
VFGTNNTGYDIDTETSNNLRKYVAIGLGIVVERK